MINKSLNSIKSKVQLKIGKGQNFNFLMGSMERDKQNFNLNRKSIISTQPNIKRKSFFKDDNIQNRQSNLPLNYINNKDGQLRGFIQKVISYIKLNNSLPIQRKTQGQINQLRILGDEIQQITQSIKLNPGIIYSNIELRKSLTSNSIQFRRAQILYKQRLQQIETTNKKLSQQNERLKKLISKHQQTNIKMHIKINQGECSEIQYYKTQLEESYKAYKMLSQKLFEYQIKFKTFEKQTQQKQYLKSRRTELNQEQVKIKQINSSHQTQLKKIIHKQNLQIQDLQRNMKQIVAKSKAKQIVIKQLKQKKFNDDYLTYTVIQASTIEQLLQEKYS